MGHYRLQVFMGPMWSGKTNRLIQAVDIARQNFHQVIVIKPLLDNRTTTTTSTSNTPTTTPSSLSSSSISTVTASSIHNERPIIRARTGLSLPVDLYIHELNETIVPNFSSATDSSTTISSSWMENSNGIRNKISSTNHPHSSSYGSNTIHNTNKHKSILYAIDEAQFFGTSLQSFWDYLASSTPHSLIISGLDYDYRRKIFGGVLPLATSSLLSPKPLSSQIYRLTARCAYQGAGGNPPQDDRHHYHHGDSSFSSSSTSLPCNKPAAFTQRLKRGGTDIILVGGEEAYAPACEHHHIPEPVDEQSWGRVT